MFPDLYVLCAGAMDTSLSSGQGLTDLGRSSLVDSQRSGGSTESRYDTSPSGSTDNVRLGPLSVPRGAGPTYRGDRRSTANSGSSGAAGGRVALWLDIARQSVSTDVPEKSPGPSVAHVSPKQPAKPARRKSATKNNDAKLSSKRRRTGSLNKHK